MGSFMSQFLTHMILELLHVPVSNPSDFGNSAEEFYRDETLSTPIKLLSSLTSLGQSQCMFHDSVMHIR